MEKSEEGQRERESRGKGEERGKRTVNTSKAKRLYVISLSL